MPRMLRLRNRNSHTSIQACGAPNYTDPEPGKRTCAWVPMAVGQPVMRANFGLLESLRCVAGAMADEIRHRSGQLKTHIYLVQLHSNPEHPPLPIPDSIQHRSARPYDTSLHDTRAVNMYEPQMLPDPQPSTACLQPMNEA